MLHEASQHGTAGLPDFAYFRDLCVFTNWVHPVVWGLLWYGIICFTFFRFLDKSKSVCVFVDFVPQSFIHFESVELYKTSHGYDGMPQSSAASML